MAAALAAQSRTDPAQQQRALALWQSIEPGNLAPLLLAQAQNKLPVDTLLERVATATMNRDWMNEAFQTLYSVPPPSPGGVVEFVQQVNAVGVHAARVEPLNVLIEPCKQPASPQRAEQCARAAERMWALQPPTLFAAAMTLSMIRAQPTLHAQWAERARSVEAQFGWHRRVAIASADEDMRRAACLPSQLSQGLMVDRLTQGEWVHTQAQLPTDPAALAELAAQYRGTRGGRGLLDPPAAPVRQPATPR